MYCWPLDHLQLLCSFRLRVSIRGLRAPTLEWRLHSARELALLSRVKNISKKELLDELMGSGALDEVCGERLHVGVLAPLEDIFKLAVREGRWGQALTTRLWLAAQGRHSSEQAAIFALLNTIARAEASEASAAFLASGCNGIDEPIAAPACVERAKISPPQ